MNNEKSKVQVPAQKTSGLTNDFTDQEQTMTNSAMPPTFQLAASGAGNNPGNVKVADASAKNKSIPQIGGIPADLLKKLYDFEGLKWEVYKDSEGKLTGGLGHLIKDDEKPRFPFGTELSTTQVMAWAQADVGAAWNKAQEQAADLGVTDHDFTVALGSMCFQLGVYWDTKFVKTWALMKAHKWEEAAIEAADSEWAKQTPTRLHDFQAALRKLANPSTKSSPSNDLSVVKPSASPKSATASPDALHGDIARIKQVQTKLQALGLYNGSIDGKEKRSDGKESNTTKGIKEFQESQHLPVTGTVDDATWAALNKGESLSIWKQFMANLEKQQAEKANAPKTPGLAAPFTKLAAEAKKKAAGEECADSGVSGKGNFVDDKYWRSQLEEGEVKAVNKGGSNCRYVASEMLLLYLKGEMPEMVEKLGLADTGDLKKDVGSMAVVPSETEANFLSILEEDKSHKSETHQELNYNPDEWYVEGDQTSKAITYIESYLGQNVPVLVGVDHTYNRDLSAKISSKYGNGYNEGTTDHFITLTGIGTDDKGGKYYSFVDPGRSTKAAGSGANEHNRLYHQGGGTFKASGTGSSNAQTYHLSMVVLFPTDRTKFADERKENRKKWN
jgi:GH24 family phage-related lysozyme (muramidase)